MSYDLNPKYGQAGNAPQPLTAARDIDPCRDAPVRAQVDALYRRIGWRLMPLLLVAQVLAYLDRINIGTAKLQMAADLGFSATVYGLGAGIFFVGYFVFEIPSNVLLHRLGARTWIARIMISWGVLSAATMFVGSVNQFYLQRFLLGIAEAGFFPGIVLYLTYWFPDHRRGRMTTLFMTATAISGVIGGPLSGWILTSFDGYHGSAGWRWMFLFEALPSILVGIIVFFRLPGMPHEVRWLSAQEREWIETDLAKSSTSRSPAHRIIDMFKGPVVVFAAIYFLLLAGLYGVSFWLPSLIKAAGVADTFTVGWLSAIPYAVAAVVMNLVARRADRMRSWGFHVGLCAIVAGVGFCASSIFAQQIVPAMVSLTIASAGILSALPLFWNLPTARLSGTAAAVGIAFINSIGNLSGFVSPVVIGWLTDLTHRANAGIILLGAAAVVAGAITLVYDRSRRIS